MKRLLSMLLALTLVMALSLAACGPAAEQPTQNQPTQNGSQGNEGSPTDSGNGGEPSVLSDDYEKIDVSRFDKTWNLDTDALGTYELSLSMQDPATASKTIFLEEWAKIIREATNGGVDITVFASGTLATAGEVLPAVTMGVADLGWVPTNSFVTQLPISSLFGLACIGMDSNTMATEVVWDVYEEMPEVFEDELGNYKLLMFWTSGKNGVSAKTAVTTLDDMQGLKLRAVGGIGVDVATILGAAPISMSPNEVYDAMSKGVLDGYIFDWSGIGSLRLYEETNYYNTRSFYTSPTTVLMNLDAWNQLPAEYQEVMDYYSLREMSLQYAYDWEYEIISCAAEYATPDQFVDFSDEEWNKIKDIVADYNAERTAAVTTATFDGDAFLARIVELVEKYESENYEYYRFKN